MAVTRESLLQEIREAIDQNAADKMQHTLGYWGPQSGVLGTAAMNSYNKINQLKDLLSTVDSGTGSFNNPFSTGGSNGGAPTVDTSNRFEAGLTDAESRLRSLLDNPDSINQSAAYKFRVKQGEDALQRNLGARGLLNSGNRLMELTKYGQDMGSQEYENQFGRLGNLLSNYSGSWIGDKNANTSRFAATSNAWNQAQANADQNRYNMGRLAQSGGNVISRSSGGMRVPDGTLGGLGDSNIGHITNTGYGSLRTVDNPYDTGFGYRDQFGRVSGRSAF